MWGVMEQGSELKAARNRASKKWGESFERCDGGSREKVGGGMVGWARGCSVRKNMLRRVAHKYSRRRRRRLQRRCEGVEKAAAFEGEGGGVGGGGGCVRNRSKDGRRCRIECAVDGEEEWGGGMVGWTRGCSVRKSCEGLRTSTAADAGDVCSDGVKGQMVL